ncbi:hypothetical protein ASG22_02495 [Chryseobacterium sp. Leaf405]|uniref:hypothetical protein n=1 Tax=Chryseobacterium sp. Leaf405 TaxID=1736367 RepID=UPI0006F4E524|nr:hypothetical protein [Chryseobacterium sp. Leaf405]KQT35908.1 hypothetical protein ASG22_02495 [Chryseobacterium sp. Leaf405]
MKIFLAIIISFLTTILFEAQTMIIETFPDKKFKIQIEDKNDQYNFEILFLDSISSNKKYEQKFFKYENKKQRVYKKTGHYKKSFYWIQKMDDLTERNSYYSYYNLSIKKSEHKDFTELIDKIENSSDEDLENIDKRMVVLHGAPIHITITDGSNIRRIYNNAEVKEYYPFTTKLISQSFSFFRERKIFVNKLIETNGY